MSQTKATENIISPVTAANGKYNMRLWELMGEATDSGGFLGIYARAAADAVDGGDMHFQIVWLAN